MATQSETSSDTANRTVIENVPTQLLIGGSWVDAGGSATFDVTNPADGSVLTSIADGTPDDGERALAAAAAAQAEWRATEPRTRGEVLRSAFELLTERADDFARLMTLEMGKTLTEARGEVTYGAEFFRWFSEEAVRIHGRYAQAPAGNTRLVTMKGPVGPTGFFIVSRRVAPLGAVDQRPWIRTASSENQRKNSAP